MLLLVICVSGNQDEEYSADPGKAAHSLTHPSLSLVPLVKEPGDQVAGGPSGALKHLFSPPPFTPTPPICPIHMRFSPCQSRCHLPLRCEYMCAHMCVFLRGSNPSRGLACRRRRGGREGGWFHTHGVHGAACGSLARGQTCTRTPTFIQLIKGIVHPKKENSLIIYSALYRWRWW